MTKVEWKWPRSVFFLPRGHQKREPSSVEILELRAICRRSTPDHSRSDNHYLSVYSAFHPSGVGKWVPVIAGKAKAGMAHSDYGLTCGCAGKTVTSLENTCHTWALLRWWFTTSSRYIKCIHLYLYLPIFLLCSSAISIPTRDIDMSMSINCLLYFSCIFVFHVRLSCGQ